MTRPLILASTSPYRQQLLQQLGLPFTAVAPLGEEFLDQSVAPELLVKHLALQKASSLRDSYDDALILGSDQVFVNPRGTIMGKPGSAAGARRQLQAMAGKTHCFYTGIALYDCRSKRSLTEYVSYSVTLRELTAEQIAYYVEQENPIDCAGSFKIEGLGISLMEEMAGEDYTSLIGLPLIRLTLMLQDFGVDVLSPAGCLSHDTPV
ncbi:MAG: septum formation protein Maf [Desulfuromonadales bacterium C00003068]|nr:MAG: septum formation protein Maf [Desulfuromonadales bacterium C00003068]